MSDSACPATSRRHFLATVVPACAVSCLGFKCVLAQETKNMPVIIAGNEQPDHIFDAAYPRKLTYRQFFKIRYGESIQLAKAMQDEMGKEKLIEFLKKNTGNQMLDYGKAQAKEAGDRSLRRYTEQFRNIENYKNMLAMEIVEDTEKAFELKVTDCIWASTFRDAEAGELGYAMVCFGDYGWAEGFNPKITLVRDKTLMQGDTICNHRYVWQA
jgi:hypothetical protein